MKKYSTTAGLCVFAALISGPLQGDIIPISQTRTLDTGAVVSRPAGNITDFDHAEAVDFGPFSMSIQSSADGGNTSASANASQNSQITVAGFSAIGSADAFVTGGNDTAQTDSQGHSFFFLTFDLTAPGTVSGLLTTQITGGFLSDRRALLSIPGIGSWSADGANPSTPVSVNLPVGNYSITIEAITSNFSDNFQTGTASASFDIQLVPEPSTSLLLVGGVVLLRRRR